MHIFINIKTHIYFYIVKNVVFYKYYIYIYIKQVINNFLYTYFN